jgi:hypothetical protein
MAMWILFARAPPPDAPYWPGRRWLAVLDAAAWPCAWVIAVRSLPAEVGVVGAIVCAVAVLSAIGRVRTALWHNHRYRFTTWRWAKVLAWVLMMGALLRLLMLGP